MESDINNNEKTTYLHLSDAESGMFEIDLVTFREKGQQTKFLSVTFTSNENGAKPVTKSFDEESFNTIKSFFAQLDWNK